jgi:hypothetical protein
MEEPQDPRKNSTSTVESFASLLERSRDPNDLWANETISSHYTGNQAAGHGACSVTDSSQASNS